MAICHWLLAIGLLDIELLAIALGHWLIGSLTVRYPGHAARCAAVRMAIEDTYPLFTVSRLTESRDFFVTHFDRQLLFQATWWRCSPSAADASV
jgi:hypothetical protein